MRPRAGSEPQAGLSGPDTEGLPAHPVWNPCSDSQSRLPDQTGAGLQAPLWARGQQRLERGCPWWPPQRESETRLPALETLGAAPALPTLQASSCSLLPGSCELPECCQHPRWYLLLLVNVSFCCWYPKGCADKGSAVLAGLSRREQRSLSDVCPAPGIREKIAPVLLLYKLRADRHPPLYSRPAAFLGASAPLKASYENTCLYNSRLVC